MFINKIIERFHNSKAAKFLSDSFLFENIDDISFVLLAATIISTAFMPSGTIGLLASVFVLSCVFKMFVKKGEAAELSFLNKVLIVYFLFVIVSLFGASLFMLSLKGILKTAIYLAFYFAAVYFLSTNKKRIIPVMLIIAGIISFEGITAIMQNISHIEAIATWQDTSNVSDSTKIISRAYGTLKPYNPNLLAGWLITGLSSIVALFGIAVLKKRKKTAIVLCVLFLTTFFAVFATGSRGAYLGLFGFMSVLLLYALYVIKNRFGGFKKIKTKYKAVFASIISFCLIVAFFIPSFRERILSIFSLRKDSSISFRMNVYEACYQMFLDNKFLGIGVGNNNFREIYGLYMKTGYDALGSYSVPLEIAVESGIFAFLTFFLFILLVVIRSIKFISYKGAHPYNRLMVFSVLLTVSAVMFHGLFDTVFFRPQIQILFWTYIAIFHAVTIKRAKLTKLRLLK